MSQHGVLKSLYKPVSKAAIISEYAAASRCPAPFEKVKWGSEEGMLNRFRLGLAVIDWQDAARWLDVGCGTGEFFLTAESAGHRFQELAGVDITPQLLDEARQGSFSSPTTFLQADLEAIPDSFREFDLITLVGVLQQCGAPPRDALAACLECLKIGGQIFLTTKHIGWKAFSNGDLKPEQAHSWFAYDELASTLKELGVEVVHHGGLLPREGRQVPLEDSHTLYLVGKKIA